MIRLCRKCGGNGWINTRVAAVGPIRPWREAIFADVNTSQNFVMPGKVMSARVSYECPKCKGDGNID